MEIRLIVSSAVRVCTARLRHSDGAAVGFRFQREKNCMKSGNVPAINYHRLDIIDHGDGDQFRAIGQR